MLYKIDYTRLKPDNTKTVEVGWVKNAADETEAISKFMNDWFSANIGHRIRLEQITCIEFTGDLGSVDEFIRCLTSPSAKQMTQLDLVSDICKCGRFRRDHNNQSSCVAFIFARRCSEEDLDRWVREWHGTISPRFHARREKGGKQ